MSDQEYLTKGVLGVKIDDQIGCDMMSQYIKKMMEQ